MNTCRDDYPDAGTDAGGDAGSDAGSCRCDPGSGSSCAYDGSGHTEPIFYITGVLVAYQ
jgi:hypothetical protein